MGSHPIAGKSIGQVDAEVTEILGRDFLVDPQITIEIKESARLWVTIMGEVRTPGRYALKRDMRLIDLLAEANGLTKDAGSRILVTRRDQAGDVSNVQIARDRLFSEGNSEANILLERNDIVTVGAKDYYYIRGEVARPGPYYLESGTTVLKAIAVAGGMTQFGNRRQVELIRKGEEGLNRKIEVNLRAIEDGKIPDVPLLPDDTIIVLKKVF
jgi:polysaccharide export outer membrane protein